MDRVPLTARRWRRLQRQLHTTRDARLYRRTLAVLEVSRGTPIPEVAQLLGVTPRSIYHWISAYALAHDPEALADAPRSGRPSSWAQRHQQLLRELLGQSPQQLGYAAVDWTVPLLQEHLDQRGGRWLSDDTIRRELDRLGYVWKRFRYVLPPDPEREKKTCDSPAVAGLAVA